MGLLIIGCVLAVFGFTFLVLLKVYAVLTLGKCHSYRKLHGKTALVTGSNRGIGYITALNLAKRGAKVIITSENHQDLLRAQKQMIRESGNKEIVAKHLNLLTLEGIRGFAKDIVDTEPRLDILVNNAGTSGLGERLTKDGLLPGMQVNYFGPFLLTNLLIDLLKKSGNGRIVNVASVAANISFGFDVNNINKVTLPFGFELFVYSNSKVCVATSTIEMAKRLKGTGVTVNCLHPGVVCTQIFNETKIGYVQFLANIIGPLYFKTPDQGAETTIHLAACERTEGISGKYFSDCRQSSLWANLGSRARATVWEQSVWLVGLKPEEMML